MLFVDTSGYLHPVAQPDFTFYLNEDINNNWTVRCRNSGGSDVAFLTGNLATQALAQAALDKFAESVGTVDIRS